MITGITRHVVALDRMTVNGRDVAIAFVEATQTYSQMLRVKKSKTATSYPVVHGHSGSALFDMLDKGLTSVDFDWFQREFNRDAKSNPKRNFLLHFDRQRGLISIQHNGSISWDDLQAIKSNFLGDDACCIEIYPPQSRVVNNLNMRHLWLLGPSDWWPDLGHEGELTHNTLRSRFEATVRAA